MARNTKKIEAPKIVAPDGKVTTAVVRRSKEPVVQHIGTGRYCEQVVTAKRRFNPDSFQWKLKGAAWHYMGCSPPRGWHPNKRTCSVGLETYKILTPKRPHRRCPTGTRLVDKG